MTTDRAPSARSARPAQITVALTLVPFLARATEYALIGSYVPIAVFTVFAGLVVFGGVRGGATERRAFRAWAGAIVLWGVARLVVQGMIVVGDLSEAHLRSQLTWTFSLVSAAYLVAGLAIWRLSGARESSETTGEVAPRRETR